MMLTSTKFVIAPFFAALAGFSASVQAQSLPGRVRPPAAIEAPRVELGAPPGLQTPAEQTQMQGNRDALETRQRELENRAGPQNPEAEIGALRNQAQLNQLNGMGK
jgi:hypothetical protein